MRHLSKADSAQSEVSYIASRPAANAASVILANLELRFAVCFFN